MLDPSKHSSWWRRLLSSCSEDVFKTSWRRLDQDEHIRYNHTSSEDVFKTSWSRPINSSCSYVFKTSSRRLQEVLPRFFKTSSRRLQEVLQKRLQDIFKTSSRRFQDVFKTSSRRLRHVLKKSSRRLQDIFKMSCKGVFKTVSRRIIKLCCSC